MILYILEKNYEYEAMRTVDEYYLDLVLYFFKGQGSIADKWEIAEVEFIKDRKLKKGADFCTITTSVPIFTEKALNVLKDILEANGGELLPMEINGKKTQTLYAYNIFPEIDCLDIENPELSWNNNKSAIFPESKVFFIKDRINKEIFKTKYMFTSVLVTDAFVNRVLENKLTGFGFIPLWDSEKGYIRTSTGFRYDRIVT